MLQGHGRDSSARDRAFTSMHCLRVGNRERHKTRLIFSEKRRISCIDLAARMLKIRRLTMDLATLQGPDFGPRYGRNMRWTARRR
jgi:hypothetical protein